MTLSPRWRLSFRCQLSDDILGHRFTAASVLLNEPVKGWLDVNQFDPYPVSSEQVNPPLTSLPDNVGGVEGERSACPQKLPTAFSSNLNDIALIVGWCDIQFTSDVVERDSGQFTAIASEPCVFAAAGKAAHHHDMIRELFVWDIVQ